MDIQFSKIKVKGETLEVGFVAPGLVGQTMASLRGEFRPDEEWEGLLDELSKICLKVYEFGKSEKRPIHFRGIDIQHKATTKRFLFTAYRVTEHSPYGHSVTGFSRFQYDPDTYSAESHLTEADTDTVQRLMLWAKRQVPYLLKDPQGDLFAHGNGKLLPKAEALTTN